MKTFTFTEKNGSGVLAISAIDLDDAIETLNNSVNNPMGWRVENEDGEKEYEQNNKICRLNKLYLPLYHEKNKKRYDQFQGIPKMVEIR